MPMNNREIMNEIYSFQDKHKSDPNSMAFLLNNMYDNKGLLPIHYAKSLEIIRNQLPKIDLEIIDPTIKASLFKHINQIIQRSSTQEKINFMSTVAALPNAGSILPAFLSSLPQLQAIHSTTVAPPERMIPPHSKTGAVLVR